MEFLEQNQKSMLELKKSVDSILSKSRQWNEIENKSKISKLEKRDSDLISEKVRLEKKISEIREFEKRTYEKKFNFYTGTVSAIARQVNSEREKFSWTEKIF